MPPEGAHKIHSIKGCRLLQSALVFVLIFVTGSDATEIDTEQQPVSNTVSGTLNLSLYRRDEIGVYVSFQLTEFTVDGLETRIAQSDAIRVSDQPVLFTLTYPPDRVKLQNRYLLITTVSEDREGNEDITSMSYPVLTQGHGSVVHLAIQQTPEPTA